VHVATTACCALWPIGFMHGPGCGPLVVIAWPVPPSCACTALCLWVTLPACIVAAWVTAVVGLLDWTRSRRAACAPWDLLHPSAPAPAGILFAAVGSHPFVKPHSSDWIGSLLVLTHCNPGSWLIWLAVHPIALRHTFTFGLFDPTHALVLVPVPDYLPLLNLLCVIGYSYLAAHLLPWPPLRLCITFIVLPVVHDCGQYPACACNIVHCWIIFCWIPWDCW